MVWPFSQKIEAVIDEKSEQKAEEDLLKELPADLGAYLKFKSREHFNFNDKEQDSSFPNYKKAHPSKSIPMNNCADYQLALMNCLSNGSSMDKLTMCKAQSDRFQDCLKFQKVIMHKLGIEHSRSINKYERIERAADDIGLRWFDEVKDPEDIPETTLNAVYDKRDEIWR